MNESLREKLLEMVEKVENGFSDLMHQIDEDENIPESTWREIDNNSHEAFYYISLLKEYLIFNYLD